MVNKIILDKEAIKELFKEYSTHALKQEIRQEISNQINDAVRIEVKKKLDNFQNGYHFKNMFENYVKSVMKNIWIHETSKLTEEMKEIILKEFNNKAKKVKFDNIENTMLKEAKKMLEMKATKYNNIIKLINNIDDDTSLGTKDDGQKGDEQ